MNQDGGDSGLAEFFTKKTALLDSLQKGYTRKALKLFVAMSMMLNNDDLKKLGPLIWDQHLDETDDPSAVAAVSIDDYSSFDLDSLAPLVCISHYAVCRKGS